MKRRNKLLLIASLFFVFGLYAFLIETSLSPKLPTPEDPPLLYSNQSQQDLSLTLNKAIQGAQKSIHLVMFGLTDPQVLHSLKMKAEENVSTRIFYDPTASLHPDLNLQYLQAIPVKDGGLMHQKILVVDGQQVFLGSANLTRSSLNMHDNLVIGMYSPKLARFLTDKAPHSSGYTRCMVGGQEVELWLLPDPRGYALNTVRNLLKKAQKTIKIAMFTLTHPNLIDELINSARKGVKVTVVIDFHAGIGASTKAIDKLKRAGIKVLYGGGTQLLHHKFLYIDEQTLLTGSANWTKAAFYKNHDCFLILHSLTQDQKKFMDKLWNTIVWEGKPIPEPKLVFSARD